MNTLVRRTFAHWLLSKPFQVISKLQVRYTGIFQDIDQETQTLCLSEGKLLGCVGWI